jgi:methionyl-tRNA formyltransferase
MVGPARPASGPTSPVRIVFFGTPEFAVPSFAQLLRSRHRVVGVVTQPDRPHGRGQHRSDGPVKAMAVAHELPVLQPERLQDPGVIESVQSWRPDLGIVVAYGRLLSQALLDVPHLGMINVHASLLPTYRGAAPIQRAVMAGERETGITIMRVVRELDAGPMLGTLVYPIRPDHTGEDLERELAFLGAALLLAVVDDLAAGQATEIPQDPAQATYAARLTKAEGLIDWTLSARTIHDQIRGLRPWPQAFTYLNGVRYILLASQAGPASVSVPFPDVAKPGEILVASGDQFIVKTGDGSQIQVLEIQPEGRKPLSAREFLAGHPLRPRQVFGGREP